MIVAARMDCWIWCVPIKSYSGLALMAVAQLCILSISTFSLHMPVYHVHYYRPYLFDILFLLALDCCCDYVCCISSVIRY